MKRRLQWLGWLCACALAVPVAEATETQLWISDSPADYAKAETRGAVVGPDGVIRLGPSAASSNAESLTVIWSIAILRDGSVALGGDGGRIDRWTESGGVRPWVKLGAGQVLTLAADGDGLLAGTGPLGVVYRISASGDTSRFASTGQRYVWGLVPTGKGQWLAATGTQGRLMRIASGGKVTTVLDTDESNLVSLIADGKGGGYAGGDSRGRIFHVDGDGRASTVFDAAEDEIRALASGPGGSLYAAGLSASATKEDDERVQPVKSAISGSRAVVYQIVRDTSATQLWTSPHPFVFALAAVPATGDREAGVVAATGNRAGLFMLSRPGHSTQWLGIPQGQVTALARDARGRLYAATSNPGALWRVGPNPGERGEILSAVHDARRFARFGRVSWRGNDGGGRVEIETRSGNTDPPDTTWTSWAATRDGRSVSPAARYLQWKLALRGGNPAVDAVEVAWREQNLPPRIEEVVVAPQGIGFREGDLTPRTEPVTQSLPGGQRVEYSTSSSQQKSLRELPNWARGLRTLQWKASDPNGDDLSYQIDLRSESGEEWTTLEKDVTSTSFTWDTNSLPDGRYRLRIRASDAPGNPVGEARMAEGFSEPFTIDNTAPGVGALEVSGKPGAIAVEGRAEDGQSILTRLEIAVDDGEWRILSPEGGLADSRALTFRVQLPDVTAGEHSVAVRAVDLAGNSTTRAARVKVPRGR